MDTDNTMPPRSWQSALRQLADTLAPGANVEIDPMDPEVSCARIAEAVERRIVALDMCDVCGGSGRPVSGLPCACGGTGRMSNTIAHLRELALVEQPR